MNEAFSKETKKGNRANCYLIAKALESFEQPAERYEKHLFYTVLLFLYSVSDEYIQKNKKYIDRICCSHFSSPERSISLLNDNRIRSKLLIGLSKFVWHCEKSLLEGADVYYSNIYKLFCQAKGSQRDALLIIALAIKKATNKSITELQDMLPKHALLFQNIENSHSFV